MKKEYRLAEDLFIVIAILLFVLAGAMKLFDFSFFLGLSALSAIHLFKLGVVSLLFSIALNVQQIAKK